MIKNGVINGIHLEALREAVNAREAGSQEGDGNEEYHDALEELKGFLDVLGNDSLVLVVGFVSRTVDTNISILASEQNKPQVLCSELEASLIASKSPVRAGTYRVCVLKESKK